METLRANAPTPITVEDLTIYPKLPYLSAIQD
jgi:hypothetical protein